MGKHRDWHKTINSNHGLFILFVFLLVQGNLVIHDISSEYLVLSGVLINEAGYRQCIFSSKPAPLAEAFNRMHTQHPQQHLLVTK